MSDEALTDAIAAKHKEIELEKDEMLKAAQLKQVASKVQNGTVNGNHQQNNKEPVMNGQPDKAQVQAQSQIESNSAPTQNQSVPAKQVARAQANPEY